ncbi:MAG: GntR family transcriptional regulator [Thermoleophilia bacterium]|nr:GntR family transcriptional regulator [Thermoleophilia bacterium]
MGTTEIDWASRLRLRQEGFVPLYHQLKELLRAAALEVAPGTLMPSEKQLMEHAGVSRATARKAVSDLVQEGVLVSERGRGTFAASRRLERDPARLAGFTEAMRLLGRATSTDVLAVEAAPASEESAERLSLEPGDPTVVFRRLRRVDGEPCMVTLTHVSATLLPGIARRDLSGSFYEILRRDYGLTPVRGRETIVALSADRELARLLRVAVGAPILSSRLGTETERGTPLEYTIKHARGDLYAVTVDTTADAHLLSPEGGPGR